MQELFNSLKDEFIAHLAMGGVIFLSALYIVKVYIDSRIKSQISHQYDKLLEQHKADLQVTIQRAIREDQQQEIASNKRKESDAKLYQKFIKDLPANGSIRTLSEHNYNGFAFRADLMSELHNFQQEWSTPDREFHDAEIQAILDKLKNAIDVFVNHISFKTYMPNSHCLKLGHENSDEWSTEYESEARKVQEMAQKQNELHQQIIVQAKKNLIL